VCASDGTLVQVDRGKGTRPFNPRSSSTSSRTTSTPDSRPTTSPNYLEPWSKLLESRGYPPAEARDTVLTVLPDLLHYDRDQPAHYPNGRVLTDDVYDMRMAFLTHGR
jgi:hypothetical protein